MSRGRFVYRWVVPTDPSLTAATAPTPYVLAVDFGGTKVEAALVDAEGRLVEGSRHRRPTGRNATVPELEESVGGVVRAAAASLPSDAAIIGVGIGSADSSPRSTCRTGATTRCATSSPASPPNSPSMCP